MVALLRPGGRTRRGAWIGALRPISLRGVASQSVGRLLEERVQLSVVVVEKRLLCVLAER